MTDIERFEKFSHVMAEISKCWHKLATDEMEKYGLKGTHSRYLLALSGSEEGLTAPQICEFCSKDKADVSRMMSILEKADLVIKEGGFQNRYNGVFRLTEKGKESAEVVKKRASKAVELAGKDLSEEKRMDMYYSLESISKNLKELCKDGIPL